MGGAVRLRDSIGVRVAAGVLNAVGLGEGLAIGVTGTVLFGVGLVVAVGVRRSISAGETALK
jgi:hypothetical protein